MLLFFKVLQFFFDVFPVIGIRQVCLHAGDAWPVFGQVYVHRDELDLISRNVFFRVNGIHRAFWNAHGAVNAFIGIDDQKIGAFAETINRAYVHAIGVFAFDAGLGNYVCHGKNVWLGKVTSYCNASGSFAPEPSLEFNNWHGAYPRRKFTFVFL